MDTKYAYFGHRDRDGRFVSKLGTDCRTRLDLRRNFPGRAREAEEYARRHREVWGPGVTHMSIPTHWGGRIVTLIEGGSK